MPDNSIIYMTPGEWTAQNPILLAGQIGVEIDVRNGVNTVPSLAKVGDGLTRYNALSYWNPTGGGSDVFGPVTSTQNAIVRWNSTDGTLVANSGALLDSNNNISANNLAPGLVSIITSGTPVVLTLASKGTQVFTGSAAQTVTLPVVSTLPQIGFQYLIINDSSNTVTVNSSGANAVQAVVAGARALITCTLLTGTTAASWASTYVQGGIANTAPVNTIPRTNNASGNLNASQITDDGGGITAIGSTPASITVNDVTNVVTIGVQSSGSESDPSVVTFEDLSGVLQLNLGTLPGADPLNQGQVYQVAGALMISL